MTTFADITAWLGHAVIDATTDQIDTLVDAANTIAERWPDPDDADSRELALSAAAQLVLGDSTLDAIAEDWKKARRIERERMAALTGALIVTPGSERERADRAGVARMTVRKAMGKA